MPTDLIQASISGQSAQRGPRCCVPAFYVKSTASIQASSSAPGAGATPPGPVSTRLSNSETDGLHPISSTDQCTNHRRSPSRSSGGRHIVHRVRFRLASGRTAAPRCELSVASKMDSNAGAERSSVPAAALQNRGQPDRNQDFVRSRCTTSRRPSSSDTTRPVSNARISGS